MKRARRGNSKNLQSQANQDENKSDGRRKLRSAKSGDTDQVESSDGTKTKRKNINLTRFLYKNKEDRPESLLQKAEHDSDDFETPVKKIKRAPKLSQPKITNRNGTTNKGNNVRPKAKRQQKITTAFLRSEQMFSEVAAQHALADNLNPDDVQLALALSRSQLETNIGNSQESAVSADNLEASTDESIRSKLQKFGYRTGNKEAYSHDFVEAFLTNQRRTKTKWANKFTALTLRNPKIQNRKLNENIDAILKRQFVTKSMEDYSIIGQPYQMQSTMLNQYAVVDKEALRFRNAEMLSTTEHLDRYFVAELFPVTHLPSGHLLKNWATIPGRDRSPERDKSKGRSDSQAVKRKYEYFYKELEMFYSKEYTNTPQEKEQRMSEEQEIELKAPIEASPLSQVDERKTLSIIQNSSETVSMKESSAIVLERVLSPIYLDKEIVNEIPSTEMDDSIKSHDQNSSDGERFSKSQESQNKESTPIMATMSMKNIQKPLEDKCSKNEQNGCSSEMLANVLEVRTGAVDCLNIKMQTRPTSPDLFADSDSDCAADAVESNKLTDITTYEVYSSDEVKTSCEVSYRTELLSVKADNVVDLTQGSDELKSPKHKKQNISKRLDFLDIPKEMTQSYSSEICSTSDGKNDILEKKDIESLNDSTIANIDLTHSDDSSNDTIKELENSLCNKSKHTMKDKMERLSITNMSQNRMSPTVEENNLQTYSNKSPIYDEENVSLSNEHSFYNELGIEPLNDSIGNIDLTQSDHDCDNAFNEFEDSFSTKSIHKSMNRMERLSIVYDNQNRMSPVIEENDLEMFSDKSPIYNKENDVHPKEHSFYDEPGIEPLNDSIGNIDLTQSDHDCDNAFNEFEDSFSTKSIHKSMNRMERLSMVYDNQNRMSPVIEENDFEMFSDKSPIYNKENDVHPKEHSFYDEPGINPLNDSIDDIDLTQSDHEDEDGDVCILLSDDDEVNYSIKKANRTLIKPKLSSSQSSLSSNSSSEESFKNAEIDDNACIMLSDNDDEVNYSIKKANRTKLSSSKSLLQSINKSTVSKCFNESDEDYEELEKRFRNIVEYNFSVLDLIDVEKSFRVTEQNDEIFPKNASFDLSGDIEPILKECLSTQENVTRDCRQQTPTKKEEEEEQETISISEMLKKQRAEFGILESQSETFSPKHWMRTPVKESTPPRNFDAYQIQQSDNVRTTPQRPSSDVFPMEFNDFDEFDRMVYGSPTKNLIETQAQCNVPRGLSQLLTAEISFNARSVTPPRKYQPSQSPSSLAMSVERTPQKSTQQHRSMAIDGVITPVRKKQQTSLPIGGIISPEKAKEFTYDDEEVTINDHVYIVRRTDSPEPNFSAQSDDELLKQLANFGIKPLKRNLAIKFLKYIYDETHPIIETERNENDQMSQQEIVCNKKTSAKEKKGSKPQIQNQTKKFDLQDCNGDQLLRYTTELCAELRDDEEVYIFQTNVRKNTQHPLLPLHIAWFNLVCSSEVLHESMLMYEAIDLQEIFLFFKSIGYRYDPKQLKSFFDRRCIIFRYDLNLVEKPGNRYARKPQKKTTMTNSQKTANSQIIKNSQKPTDAEQTEKAARPQKMRKFKKYTSSQRTKKLPSSQPTLQKYLSL